MNGINHIFLDFFKKYPWFTTSNIAFSLFIPLQDILLPHLYGKVITSLEKKQSILKPLIVVVVLLCIIQIGYTASDWHDTYLFPKLQAFIRKQMMAKVFEKFETNNIDISIGDVMSRIVKIPEHVSEWFERFKNYIAPYLISYAIAIGYFAYYDVYLGAGLAVLLGFFIYFVICAPWKCKAPSLSKDKALNDLHEEIDDTLRNVTSVYGKGQKNEELERIDAYENKFMRANINVMKCALSTRVTSIVVLIAFLVIFLYRATVNQKTKKLNSGAFVSMSIMLLYILNSMMVLVDQSRDMIQDVGVITNFDDFFKHKPTKVDQEKNLMYMITPHRGLIFDNVSYTYKDSQVPIIQNLNLVIRPGEKVAIVGDIGSGKSTLLKLLMRFQKPTSGTIYLNGVPYTEMSVKHLRHVIGYVPQQPVLFNRTIIENIKYGNKHITDHDIEILADTLGLSQEFAHLPEGLYTKVGKNGSKISGGQRQLVWCLRVLLSNPEIIVLDEPTASLDEKTKTLMKGLFDLFMKERTVIMVTHDPSLMSYAERTVVMKKGTIVYEEK